MENDKKIVFTRSGKISLGLTKAASIKQSSSILLDIMGKTTGKFYDCFLGKTSLAKNFQKVFRGGGGVANPVTRPVLHR